MHFDMALFSGRVIVGIYRQNLITRFQTVESSKPDRGHLMICRL